MEKVKSAETKKTRDILSKVVPDRPEINDRITQCIQHPEGLYALSLDTPKGVSQLGFIITNSEVPTLNAEGIPPIDTISLNTHFGVLLRFNPTGDLEYGGEVAQNENGIRFLRSRDGRDVYKSFGPSLPNVDMIAIPGRDGQLFSNDRTLQLVTTKIGLKPQTPLTKLPVEIFETPVVAEHIKAERQSQVSRRRFLKIACIGLTMMVIPEANKLLAETTFKDATLKDIHQLSQEILERYNIQTNIPIPTMDRIANVNPATLLENKRGLEILKQTLYKYPPGMLSELKAVIFNRDVELESHRPNVGFMYNGEPPWINISAPLVNTPFNLGGIFGDNMVGKVIDHELTHFFDYRQKYDRKNNIWVNSFEPKEDWDKLNPGGSKIYQEWGKGAPSADMQYFASKYGSQTEREDRATFGEKMMDPSDLKELEKRAKTNDVIAKKLQKMKSYYFHWSIGLMNDQYWEDLKSEKVDENYWDKKLKD